MTDIIRESGRFGAEEFTEEVRKHGNQSVKLGVSWELDIEIFFGKGRWCYSLLLAVSTHFRPREHIDFMQSDAFVECADYWCQAIGGVDVL